MKLLIVEDDEFKQRNVKRLVDSFSPEIEAILANSISSSLKKLESYPDIRIVILDMSLPTFDVGFQESGGRPQGFGGVSVIQHLEALDLGAKVIVLTQFIQFGEGDESMDKRDLEVMLKKEYPDHFFTLIHYGAGSDKWKEELTRALTSILRC